jgi:uncharacterized protein (TIGR00251 family)
VSGIRLQPIESGVRVRILVQPRARKNELVGAHGDAIKVRLMAPPVEGAANESLIEFLASTFGIPARVITIVSGTSSRMKMVQVVGVTEQRIRQLLER